MKQANTIVHVALDHTVLDKGFVTGVGNLPGMDGDVSSTKSFDRSVMPARAHNMSLASCFPNFYCHVLVVFINCHLYCCSNFGNV